jgi:hypothetical protein
MNSLDGPRSTILTLLMFPSRHIKWLVRIRYCLGFAAARRAMTSAALGSGKPDISELP